MSDQNKNQEMITRVPEHLEANGDGYTGPEYVFPTEPDWSLLKDREFLVQRKDGSVEKGWSIKKVEDVADEKTGNTTEMVVITGWDPKSGPMEKRVPVSTLFAWQKPTETSS